ncbi:glycosyltransferase family 4 protein [Deinococcus humi]|uniref:Glycosyltransferase involved in cell wall biosynthesis n=1 Tax=Deinococcus humi TaxID=662880 RepID=A0A7W8JXA7_9DEIO|nr:glycosyltransferase family 4 protein [Deinococcus humi]MBB5363446.1 glycosyltransferase involved in cell wall biosynthesis [Deinococcus humi]GGO26466.1 glycosyl transferase family 1 [Deinococcus humi]
MVHNYYQQPGGEDQSFLAESGLLSAFGHDVTRYAVHSSEVQKLGIARTAAYTIWNPYSFRNITKIIKDNHIEVVHFQNTFPLISPAAYYAAQSAGAIVIQALRNYRMTCVNGLLYRNGSVCELCVGRFAPTAGIVHHCYRGSMAGSAVVAGMVSAHKLIGTYRRRVDLFVATSEFVKQKYVEAGIGDTQIVVKPNVVAPDPGVGEGRGEYALYVGRLTDEKGLRTLLKAWDSGQLRLPLKIVGDGPLGPEIERAAGRNAGIQYLGPRSLAETYELMGDASVLVVPSEWHEPFGRVVIEAFAKGTPVVAARMGGLTELVTPGRTGELFNAGDSTDLIKKIETLTASPGHSSKLRENCRQAYLNLYTPERNQELLMSIYEYALQRQKKKL